MTHSWKIALALVATAIVTSCASLIAYTTLCYYKVDSFYYRHLYYRQTFNRLIALNPHLSVRPSTLISLPIGFHSTEAKDPGNTIYGIGCGFSWCYVVVDQQGNVVDIMPVYE
jgi:hypothetical protein